MTLSEWLALGAILIVPAMYAYERGVCRWITWLGRAADRILPERERAFANFSSQAADAAMAVEQRTLGGARALGSAMGALATATAHRLSDGVRRAPRGILSWTIRAAGAGMLLAVLGAIGVPVWLSRNGLPWRTRVWEDRRHFERMELPLRERLIHHGVTLSAVCVVWLLAAPFMIIWRLTARRDQYWSWPAAASSLHDEIQGFYPPGPTPSFPHRSREKTGS